MRHVCILIMSNMTRTREIQVGQRNLTKRVLCRKEKEKGERGKEEGCQDYKCVKAPNNHCNHCSINGHTKKKLKLQLEINPKNHKPEYSNQKNHLGMEVRKEI